MKKRTFINPSIDQDEFTFKYPDYELKIRIWGENAFRITVKPIAASIIESTRYENLKPNGISKADYHLTDQGLKINNGKLGLCFDGERIAFIKDEQIVLEEFSRKQSNVRRTIGIDEHISIPQEPTSSLNVSPYEFHRIGENSYETILRFEGDYHEKIYGMGGYQNSFLNKNGDRYELMQRNSQSTVPVYISDKKYGFIWNNSGIGEAILAKSEKLWKSVDSQYIDYVVFAEDSPKELLLTLTNMVGKAPEIDNALLGLWQSKLRYQTTAELREVYDKYLSLDIVPSVMVIDYFHWTEEGDFEFDMDYWEGIEDLADSMQQNGTKLMVSLWPTVAEESKYYQTYINNNMLLESINGKHEIFNKRAILDLSKEDTRNYIISLLEDNYRSKGAELFWADQAEPEMNTYNHSEYLMNNISMTKIGNKYPLYYAKTISEVTEKSNPILIRSVWIGSQKYGALGWSGDIESSFESLERQIQISLSMGLVGQSWWTSDIGGFHSGDSSSEYFIELMIRWFQFATFSPILRMHGDRQPHTPRIGDGGGGLRTSGGPNEIWSFGEEAQSIFSQYIKLREGLKEYIEALYKEASVKGYPIMRPMFMEYPHLREAYAETSQYFFGSDLIICPVTEFKASKISVFIPEDTWVDVYAETRYSKGYHNIEVSLDNIPVFIKSGSKWYGKIIKLFKYKEESPWD